MAQFEPLAADFRQKNAEVAFIAAEKRGGMFKPEKFFEQNPSSFPFLLDEDRSVTKAYGIYQRLRLDAINIARPATFLVTPDGVLRWIYIGSSQLDRAPLELVQQQLTPR